jgi:membrane-bound serine protease (ClpP class)
MRSLLRLSYRNNPEETRFSPEKIGLRSSFGRHVLRKTGEAAAAIIALLVFVYAAQAVYGEPSPLPHVLVIPMKDTVQPVSTEYLKRGLSRAEQEHAAAVLVELDTPGGLFESTREMVGAILSSPVPVIVYVAPSGARAGSAGFYLLESADIAAMAPGTNAGAAHPVAAASGQIDEVSKQKLENDAAAFLRSYVERRKRNATAAEDAVRKSKSYTEEEARRLGLIDVVANNDSDLLSALDGRQVLRFNGTTTTLHTRNAALDRLDLSPRERLLDLLISPDLALLFLTAGALLIYLEFNTPGTIVPGSLGALLVLLALFALNLLPLRFTAVLLLLAGFILLVLEAKFTSHGVVAGVGILCLIFGAITLVNAPIPELRVHLATAIGLALGFGIITLVLIRLAIMARRNKSKMGIEALIGESGKVMQALSPIGQVLVHGELWQAEASEPLQEGENIQVKGWRDLRLLVERIPGNASKPH